MAILLLHVTLAIDNSFSFGWGEGGGNTDGLELGEVLKESEAEPNQSKPKAELKATLETALASTLFSCYTFLLWWNSHIMCQMRMEAAYVSQCFLYMGNQRNRPLIPVKCHDKSRGYRGSS